MGHRVASQHGHKMSFLLNPHRYAVSGALPESYYFQPLGGPWSGGGTTFASMDFGDEHADRYIIASICAIQTAAGAGTINTVTIGGVAATRVVQHRPQAYRTSEIWIAPVPTGTTGDIVLGVTSYNGFTLQPYRAVGLISSTAFDTDTASTLTFDIPANGIALLIGANMDINGEPVDQDFSNVYNHSDVFYNPGSNVRIYASYAMIDSVAGVALSAAPSSSIDSAVGVSFTTIGSSVVPEQFGEDDWYVVDNGTSGDITIAIVNRPFSDKVITDIQYQIDGGSWTTIGGVHAIPIIDYNQIERTGHYTISGLNDDVEIDIAIRAVSGAGNGSASATKAVTPTAEGSLAYVGAGAQSTPLASSFNITNFPIGPDVVGRHIVVSVGWRASGDGEEYNITTMSIGGVAGVRQARSTASNVDWNAEVWLFDMAGVSGTTATLNWTENRVGQTTWTAEFASFHATREPILLDSEISYNSAGAATVTVAAGDVLIHHLKTTTGGENYFVSDDEVPIVLKKRVFNSVYGSTESLVGYRHNHAGGAITISAVNTSSQALVATVWESPYEPRQFDTTDWSVADMSTSGDIRLTILALPNQGGSAILDIEYQIDGGSWVALELDSPFLGAYTISGFTDYQQYSFKVRAVNSYGNGPESSARLVTPTPSAGSDPYFNEVVLLIGFDGDDGSTAFVDESNSAHTISVVGNVQVDVLESKFGGGSGLFDGVGDRLTIPDSTDWEFGTDNFTIEAWVRFDLLNAWQTIVGQWGASGSEAFIFDYPGTSNGVIRGVFTANGSTDVTVQGTWVPVVNTWHHMVFERSGSNFRTYADGLMEAKTVNASAIFNSTSLLLIGMLQSGASSYTNPLFGRIDELRITREARYASDLGYTVPTTKFPRVFGASVPILFQSDQWSVSNPATTGDISITITAVPFDGGSPILDIEYQIDGGSWVALSLDSPFPGTYTIGGFTDYQEYSVKLRAVNAIGNGPDSLAQLVTPTDALWPNVKLLLGFDGSNGATSTTDSSDSARVVTRVGNTTISTLQSKFGGSSALLDGSGDYWHVPNHADFDFGSGEFTIEGWIRPTSIPTGGDYGGIVCKRSGSGNETFSFYLDGDQSGKVSLLFKNSTPTTFVARSLAAPALNTWQHVAAVRYGDNIQVFVDGVGGPVVAVSGSAIVTTHVVAIGILSTGVASTGFVGNIDEVRVIKGTALYTADFTPPTVAFPRG